jgi:hypothetical protein
MTSYVLTIGALSAALLVLAYCAVYLLRLACWLVFAGFRRFFR